VQRNEACVYVVESQLKIISRIRKITCLIINDNIICRLISINNNMSYKNNYMSHKI